MFFTNGGLVLGRKLFTRLILPEKLRTHLYLIGGSGTGKSCELYQFILQDIQHERGVGVIDVHGDLVSSLEKAIYHLIPETEERLRRVTLLDPVRGAFGFNPLEIPKTEDPYPVILELQSVFKKLWADAWGDRMADLFRNSCLVLAEHHLTLCELPRLLTDPGFRKELLVSLENSSAYEYFTERFNRLPQREQATWIESTLNKVNAFVGDPLIRDIVGQRYSTVRFREILDTPGAVLLICLPKGKLKENAYLLGALLISKIQEAALSRTEIPESKRRRFTLIIDEFQNFGAKSLNFQEILSESRKYGLSLILAHQHTDQLDEELLASVLGNTTCQISFRISRKDAERIAPELFKVDISDHEWERIHGLATLTLKERWEDFYNALTSLREREAFVAIKGQASHRIRTIDIPRYEVPEEKLKEQERGLLARHCQPRDQVRQELRARSQKVSSEEIIIS